MNAIAQPTATTCGQTSVAMVAGVSVEEACVAVGKRGATTAAELVRGLRRLGVACADGLVLVRRMEGFAPLAIARLSRAKPHTAGHWVVWADGYFMDPADGGTFRPEDFTCLLSAWGWRLTSILQVHTQR